MQSLLDLHFSIIPQTRPIKRGFCIFSLVRPLCSRPLLNRKTKRSWTTTGSRRKEEKGSEMDVKRRSDVNNRSLLHCRLLHGRPVRSEEKKEMEDGTRM